jgi:hypothetical protein
MTRARDFADVISGQFDIPAGSLDNASADVVDDASPQLGGNLDAQTYNITNVGNVGIGTTSPDEKLSLGANSNDTALSGTSNTQGLHLYARAFGIAHIDSLVSGSNNSGMSLRTYNNGTYTPFIQNTQGNTTTFATAGTERMRINASGNVGIGTTNPLAKLHVDDTNSALYFGYGGNEDIYLQTTNGNVLFTNKGATTERMRIDSSGNVYAKAEGGSGNNIDLRQGSSKGWINFNAANTPTARDSYNVTSISDVASGRTKITWNNDFDNAVYAPVSSGRGRMVSANATSNILAGEITLDQFEATTDSLVDALLVMNSSFGDLA